MKKPKYHVFKNGKIYTVNLAGTLSVYQSVAVKDDKIVYTGSDEGAEKYITADARVVDLNGKMVIPGMSDAHIHASWSGLLDKSINLYDVQYDADYGWKDYIEAYKKTIVKHMPEWEDAPVIRGAGFNAGYCMNGDLRPAKEDLDAISREKPIVLRSFCYHYAWANSKALELARIHKETPNPKNGVIFRDKSGEPTGFFQEMDAISLLIEGVAEYELSVEEYKNALKKYEYELGSKLGITMIFDALAADNAMQAYRELAKENRLNMRVRGCYYAEPEKPIEQFDDLPAIEESESYRIDTVKFFLDGTGAAFCLNRPFTKEFLTSNNLPLDYRGEAIWNAKDLQRAFLKITRAGYQIHVHCMGDGAVKKALDGFEYVKNQLGAVNKRNVIAHIMLIDENDKRRMAELGVIAAIMPCWMYVEDLNDAYYIPTFGKERAARRYPFKSLKNAGVMVTAGTDFPVSVPPNPFCEIQMAMTRSILRSDNRFETYSDKWLGAELNADERVSLKEAIESLTIAAAYQHGIEHITGSIEVGKSADLVVLSQDLEKVDALEIENTHPLMTMFQGRIVYEKTE